MSTLDQLDQATTENPMTVYVELLPGLVEALTGVPLSVYCCRTCERLQTDVLHHPDEQHWRTLHDYVPALPREISPSVHLSRIFRPWFHLVVGLPGELSYVPDKHRGSLVAESHQRWIVVFLLACLFYMTWAVHYYQKVLMIHVDSLV